MAVRHIATRFLLFAAGLSDRIYEVVRSSISGLLRIVSPSEFLACSNCFSDQGLRLDAERIGFSDSSLCKDCGKPNGAKLNSDGLHELAHSFFVRGTLQRCEYGAAPIVQFNDSHEGDINCGKWFGSDIELFTKHIGVRFFYYGPRMWMVGEVEPLKDLLTQTTRGSVIEKILRTYPLTTIAKDQVFYRVRSNLADPDDETQFDSPPANIAGSNRLDSKNFPVMYASTDLHVCIHESRLSADDDVHVATLTPTKDLKVIDLTELLEEDGTEFESLDMAVHMLFLAREHSYEICRDIALAAQSAGLDGLIYPSYFSLLRTGGMPFETGFGISLRQFAHLRDFEKSKIIPNLALFGRPIEDGKVSLRCINRVMVRRVEYDLHFGPTGI